MGEEPTKVSPEELAYYRAVEDHFCRLRGTPFLFSPMDFAYLREWWRQGIPLSAVLLGLGEAFARRREKGLDPVSSLAYCRHAVARQAKRLAQARVGSQGGSSLSPHTALEHLEEAVAEAQRAAPSPRLAHILTVAKETLKALPRDLPPAALSEALAEVEEQTLRAAAAALSDEERQTLLNRVKGELPTGQELSGRALEVAMLRALRDYLGVPRFELSPDET